MMIELKNGLLCIDYRQLGFAVVVRDFKITDVAPVAKWCSGRNVNDVVDYWIRRGATLVWINQATGERYEL
jgi:hypothetical protein